MFQTRNRARQQGRHRIVSYRIASLVAVAADETPELLGRVSRSPSPSDALLSQPAGAIVAASSSTDHTARPYQKDSRINAGGACARGWPPASGPSAAVSFSSWDRWLVSRARMHVSSYETRPRPHSPGAGTTKQTPPNAKKNNCMMVGSARVHHHAVFFFLRLTSSYSLIYEE